MGRRLDRIRAALHGAPKGVRIAVALLCLALGVVGIVIPVIPGWPLFLVGVPLLVSAFPGLDRAGRRFLAAHPRLRRHLARFRSRPRASIG